MNQKKLTQKAKISINSFGNIYNQPNILNPKQGIEVTVALYIIQ